MSLTAQGYPPSNVSVQGATEPLITKFDVLLADTEYPHVLQTNVKEIRIRCRGIADLRIAFVLGDTGDTKPYWTIPKGTSENINNITFSGKTLYLRSNRASMIVEIMELY